MNASQGIDLAHALRLARRLGCHVSPVHRTGEMVVIHGATRIRVNGRRKDCPRPLVILLRKLQNPQWSP